MFIFVLIFFLVLLSIHFFIYYFIILIFGVTKYKLILGVLFFFLSITFILSYILVHYFNNALTKAIYYISSVWLGFISNLFFLFFFLVIFLNLSILSNININFQIIGIFTIIFAIIMTLYGLYNADNPIIKNVDIKLKNLPELWKSKKVILISDVHIGAIIRERFLEKIASKIESQNPDLVFITGDLFDGTDYELDHIGPYIDLIKAKQGVYYVDGNHETFLGKELSKQLLSNTKLKILKDEIDLVDGVQIIGLNFIDDKFGKKNIKKSLSRLSGFDKDIPSILLYHAPVFLKEFRKFGINLQLSGHTHKGQFWPFGIITKIIYKGKDYGLYKKNDYNLYTTNGVGTSGPPMRIGNKPEIVILNLK